MLIHVSYKPAFMLHELPLFFIRKIKISKVIFKDVLYNVSTTTFNKEFIQNFNANFCCLQYSYTLYSLKNYKCINCMCNIKKKS